MAREYAELVRRIGETAGVLRVTDSPAACKHRPSEHDIFADAFDPTTDLFQCFTLVNRKSALGHQRTLIQRLHALDGCDAMEVVPFLRFGDPARARIAHEHRAGNCLGAGRISHIALDQVAQRVLVQVRIGVERDDEIEPSLSQATVQRRRFA